MSFLRRLRDRWAVLGHRAHHGIRRDWEAAKAANGNPLLRCGEKYFSQFDEDGILLEVLRRLDIAAGRFVEIGVGNGTENNTLILMARGWSGLWIGAEALAWQSSGKRLTFKQAFVTTENVRDLVGDSACDVLSLDIDGNDYWIAQTLLGHVTPRVVIVEYNAKCPPPIRFIMPYDPTHRWDSTDYFGASLAAWADLLTQFGYGPVCCSFLGTNAFFVRLSDLHLFADVPRALADLYRPVSNLGPLETGLPASPKTLAILERQP